MFFNSAMCIHPLSELLRIKKIPSPLFWVCGKTLSFKLALDDAIEGYDTSLVPLLGLWPRPLTGVCAKPWFYPPAHIWKVQSRGILVPFFAGGSKHMVKYTVCWSQSVNREGLQENIRESKQMILEIQLTSLFFISLYFLAATPSGDTRIHLISLITIL